ncbi:UNVERIFIED_CONTAM: hypothetical protein K2H54_062789 [Gekko kuhli]
MRIENFLEDKDEENILNKEVEIILDKDSNQLLATNRYAPLAQTTLTSTQECILEQQTSPAASGELPSINELTAKASKENILFKQTSLIAETLVNLYIKIDEMNLKDMETEELPESLAMLSTRATNRSSNCVLRLSPPVNLEKQCLNKNRPTDPPELLEDDYELDSPHLFTVYSNKHLPSIVDSKSLVEELADAAKQTKTAQLELNRQIMAKTLPAMSIHKRVNGCVLEEQFAEEIEMTSSSSGEATPGDTIPEGFQEPEHN